MKSGRFFSIPERPSDVDLLRRHAKTLDHETRPKWLQAADVDYYRYVTTRSCTGLVADEQKQFAAEISQLEAAGLLVDKDRTLADVWHVYIRSEPDYNIWSIGVYAGSSFSQLRPAVGAVNPVLTRNDISDATAVLVADPFMICTTNGWYMFFELLNWHANKGEIGLATSKNGLHWQYQQRVLVEPFHLSYPYVFEDNGSYFMIPETRQARSVRLYQATTFPTEWSLVGTLLHHDGLVDASIFRKDGLWWMLACDTVQRGKPDLRLYFAHELMGPWIEHPTSPLLQGNPRAARPAGRVIVDDGRVFRFAQNCEREYGVDVRAFEINELSRTRYQEIEFPGNPILRGTHQGWNAEGMHHLDAVRLSDGSWLACVDGWTKPTNTI